MYNINLKNIFRMLIFYTLIFFTFGCSNLSAISSDGARTPSNSDLTSPDSCQISKALQEKLTSTTFKEKINGFDYYLKNDVSKYASALDVNQPIIGNSQILFKHYEYLTQIAFAKDGLDNLSAFPKENWLSAYSFLAVKEEVDYLRNNNLKLDMKSDPDILKKIEKLLPLVNELKWPTYNDENGKDITSEILYTGADCKNCIKVIDTEFIGLEVHPQFSTWRHEAMKMNLLASPLFYWILKQPNTSIDASRLFEKGLEFYNDGWVTLGVITWIMMADAHAGNRSRAAVVSSRMKPLIQGHDQAGYNYHFWGYTLKGLWGRVSKARYYLFAFAYERSGLIQDDKLDWLIDKKAFAFGTKLRKQILNPSLCNIE